MIKEHYINYSSKPKSSEMKELVNDLIHRVCDTYKEYKVKLSSFTYTYAWELEPQFVERI